MTEQETSGATASQSLSAEEYERMRELAESWLTSRAMRGNDPDRSNYVALARAYLSLARQLAEAKRRIENFERHVEREIEPRLLERAERYREALERIIEQARDFTAPNWWVAVRAIEATAHAALHTGEPQGSPPKDSGESSTDGATTGVEGA